MFLPLPLSFEDESCPPTVGGDISSTPLNGIVSSPKGLLFTGKFLGLLPSSCVLLAGVVVDSIAAAAAAMVVGVLCSFPFDADDDCA